jgi:hypothetical protein
MSDAFAGDLGLPEPGYTGGGVGRACPADRTRRGCLRARAYLGAPRMARRRRRELDNRLCAGGVQTAAPARVPGRPYGGRAAEQRLAGAGRGRPGADRPVVGSAAHPLAARLLPAGLTRTDPRFPPLRLSTSPTCPARKETILPCHMAAEERPSLRRDSLTSAHRCPARLPTPRVHPPSSERTIQIRLALRQLTLITSPVDTAPGFVRSPGRTCRAPRHDLWAHPGPGVVAAGLAAALVP